MLRLKFQTSYYGGNERARHLLSNAPENESLVANRATLRPFEVLGSHSTIVFFLICLVFFFKKVLRLRFQSSNIGGKERARNLLSDTLENDFLVDNRATLRPFEGPRVPQYDLIFPKSA